MIISLRLKSIKIEVKVPNTPHFYQQDIVTTKTTTVLIHDKFNQKF